MYFQYSINIERILYEGTGSDCDFEESASESLLTSADKANSAPESEEDPTELSQIG